MLYTVEDLKRKLQELPDTLIIEEFILLTKNKYNEKMLVEFKAQDVCISKGR